MLGKIVFAVALSVAVASLVFAGEPVRSNGKGGGPWSAPTTWQGGKVPSGQPVVVLSKDVVDLDASAGPVLVCEEIEVDPQGALRVVGKNKTTLTVQVGKALRVFGGLMVDFSKDPEGRFECVMTNAVERPPEFLVSDGCKIVCKGAPGAAPNVAFRIVTNALPAGATAPKSVALTLGPKMYIDFESALLEGFDIQATGMDGSGVKFNERCSFRNCQFLRSHVTFSYCKKIEFEGNRISDTPAQTQGVYFLGVLNSRFTSNVVERTASSMAGFHSYGSSDCELADNIFRNCYYGMNLVACSEINLSQNRFETNTYGLFLNSCGRIAGQRTMFDGNTSYQLFATFASPVEYRFFNSVFVNSPTNKDTACLGVDGICTVDIVNSPLQSFAKENTRGPIVFSVYVDILVTNEQGAPLGRVPMRVLAGDKVVATSRTEAVGARTGYTPLPSTHRPLIVPWTRVAPAQGITTPPAATTYQLEVDGTSLGYAKQVVPLAVDESFVRPDPEKPTKTITVKLAKAN